MLRLSYILDYNLLLELLLNKCVKMYLTVFGTPHKRQYIDYILLILFSRSFYTSS